MLMQCCKEAEDDMMGQSRQTRDICIARQLQQTQQLQDNDRVKMSRTQAAGNAINMTTQYVCQQTSAETSKHGTTTTTLLNNQPTFLTSPASAAYVKTVEAEFFYMPDALPIIQPKKFS